MKKRWIMVCIILMLATPFFAKNKPGLNKLGGIIGTPTGLSFSHNFTRLDQIDLTVGLPLLPFLWNRYGFDLGVGYLRTVYEPVLGGVVCPLEVGGGLAFSPYSYTYGENRAFSMAFTVYFDLRWEIFFKTLPKFNLFLDVAPGLGIDTHSRYASPVFFAGRGGIGLRANLN